MSQLYVAILFADVNGNVAFRFACLVFQSITLLNSTRLPASPADRLIVWTNFESSVSRTTATLTRAGPFSTTVVFALPETNARGARCSSSKSMFHAGHCRGLSVEI